MALEAPAYTSKTFKDFRDEFLALCCLQGATMLEQAVRAHRWSEAKAVGVGVISLVTIILIITV